MPSKSRRRRGKYSFQGKKKKGALTRPTMPGQQPAVTQTHEPAPSPKVTVPSAGMPTSMAKPAALPSRYIGRELRTIGILAGIMLIILIVLALVLPPVQP